MRKEITVTLPDNSISFAIAAMAGGIIYDLTKLFGKSMLRISRNFNLLVFRYPSPAGWTRRRNYTSGLTTAGELKTMHDKHLLDGCRTVFVVLPPSDAVGWFVVVLLYKKRDLTLTLSKFSDCYRFQIGGVSLPLGA